MSVQQITAMIEFLEGQRELALGRCSRSKEGRSLSKRLWSECAEIVNSVSADCVQKTGEQWRTFYNDYKHKMLKKIKHEKNERIATGGGPPTTISLTPLQERLYTILGRDVGEPLPGVRHNPITQNENEGVASQANNANVVLPEENQNENALGFLHLEFAINEDEGQRDPLGSDEHSQGKQSIASGSQMAGEAIVHEPQSEANQGLSEPSGAAASQSHVQRQPTPRRRRRRRQQIPEENQENEDPAMRTATEMLQAMEAASAQATLEHAKATHRLAAALEALGERLMEPININIINQQNMENVRQKRYRVDSDSDSE